MPAQRGRRAWSCSTPMVIRSFSINTCPSPRRSSPHLCHGEKYVKRFSSLAGVLLAMQVLCAATSAQPIRFEVSVAERFAAPIDGRILLMLSTSEDGEPRFQIGEGVNSQQ